MTKRKREEASLSSADVSLEKEENETPAPSINCPFDFSLCKQGLSALKQLIHSSQQDHKQLLDSSTPIYLYVHVHKIPRCTYLRLASSVPHPFHDDSQREVCLLVRDDDTVGREFEDTVRRYKAIIEKMKLPFVVDVMTLKQLNQELVPYEAKRKLCARYDLFLADRRIITSLMRGQLLGKHFRHHGKMPIGINVFNTDFKQRILTLCHSVFGRMAGTGPLFSIPFTDLKQSVDQGIENLKAVCETVGKGLPGSWLNVDHAYLYGTNLHSLPIYYSPHTKNAVQQINLSTTKEKAELGELSTIERNLNVIVTPQGDIRFTKKNKLTDEKRKKKKKKVGAEKDKKMKRLRTWLPNKGTSRVHKTKRERTVKVQPQEPVLDTGGKPVVDAAFVDRVAQTKLAKKKEKSKHVEQDYASEPAPRAEKRKRLLQQTKEERKGGKKKSVSTDASKKAKSGGRSKAVKTTEE